MLDVCARVGQPWRPGLPPLPPFPPSSIYRKKRVFVEHNHVEYILATWQTWQVADSRTLMLPGLVSRIVARHDCGGRAISTEFVPYLSLGAHDFRL
jgi:hypothetical protein